MPETSPPMPVSASDQDLLWQRFPPVVISTSIATGTADIPAGATRLTVTFSEPMRAESWSLVEYFPGSVPPISDGPEFADDGKSMSVTFDLAPATTYAFWLNDFERQNFRDTSGRPLVPYIVAFRTA